MVRQCCYDQQQDIPKSNTSYFKAWNNQCFKMQGSVWKRNKEKISEVLLCWNNSCKGDSLILLARDKAVFSELINPPFPWKLSHWNVHSRLPSFPPVPGTGAAELGGPQTCTSPAVPGEGKESPAGRERRGKWNKFKHINKLNEQIERRGGSTCSRLQLMLLQFLVYLFFHLRPDSMQGFIQTNCFYCSIWNNCKNKQPHAPE